MKDEIFELLKTKIKGEVLIDEDTLKKYSKDTSLFEIKPSAVIYPQNILDIENLVHFVNDNKYQNPWLSLTPRSGGTCMSGGAIGTGLILDFSKNINNFDLDKNTQKAVVQPGVFYKDFEKKSDEVNLEMPVYPASKDIAAFGGMISNNCGGEKTLMYGQMRNFVNKLKVVLSNGREYEFKKISVEEVMDKAKEDSFIGGIYKRTFDLIDKNYDQIQNAKPKTSKNSSGYALWDVYNKTENTFDLTQLFTGAQGTLGIISEAEIKLVPIKKHRKLCVVMLKSWDDLPILVQKILPCKPTSLETFDSATMKLAMRFMPEIAKKSQIPINKFILSFWPEFFMGIKLMWFPKLIVLVEFEEESEYVLNEKIFEIKHRLEETNSVWRIIENEKDSEKYFVIRRESFSLLRKNVNNKQTAPFIDDFCILPDKLPEFLPDFLRILKKYKIKANIAGHAGEGNLHIIPLMNLNSEKERDKIRPCSDELYDLIIKFGGTITAEHNDGLIRTPYVEKMFGSDIYKLFQEVKNIFDPNNIFNPGKKVNGDKDFAFTHIKRGLE